MVRELRDELRHTERTEFVQVGGQQVAEVEAAEVAPSGDDRHCPSLATACDTRIVAPTWAERGRRGALDRPVHGLPFWRGDP